MRDAAGARPRSGFGGLERVSNLGNQAWRPGQWAAMALAGLLGPGLLSACDDKPRPPETPPAAATDISAHARRVAVEKIGAGVRNPAAARFRGVQVYQQADPSVIAVCGQVNPDGREDQAFIPFVSVVTYARRPDAGAPEFDIEQFVATSTSEATRMYIEMTSRCGENGGPRQVGNRKVVPPLPPLPSDLPDQIQPPRPIGTFHAPASQTALPSAPVPGPKAESIAASSSGENVTMRQAGNIRIAPVGGSPLVRVAPKGVVLKVFGQAPGGWLQVGEAAPEGWVHSSLVESP